MTIAATLESDDTTKSVCVAKEFTRRNTQPKTNTARTTSPIDMTTAPTIATAGEKVIPTAKRGVHEITRIRKTQKTKVTERAPTKARPAMPVRMGAAKPAK